MSLQLDAEMGLELVLRLLFLLLLADGETGASDRERRDTYEPEALHKTSHRRGKRREERLHSSSRSLRSVSVTRLSGSSSSNNDGSRPWLHPTLLEEPSQPRILVQWSPSKHHLSSGPDTSLPSAAL
ncbi:unnamed protein product [Boreogadus saida]